MTCYVISLELDDTSSFLSPPSSLSIISLEQGNTLRDYRYSLLTVELLSVMDHEELTFKTNELGWGKLSFYRTLSGSQDLTSLAIIAIPTSLTSGDLLLFLSHSFTQFTQVCLLRDSSPHRYIALLDFTTTEKAQLFYRHYQGKKFTSFSEETCQVVWVKPRPEEEELLLLPTCPVCLERLDVALTGLVITPCKHKFHCACLMKWGKDKCPVCRFTLLEDETTAGETGDGSICWSCSSTQALWICLICGHLGCGRYQQAHAWSHYQATGHLYALEVESQRVWDYAGDGYVHRLLQNKVDGKLVELPSTSPSPSSASAPTTVVELTEKQSALEQEYNQLLWTQLESQRQYYEQELEKAYALVAEIKHQQQEYQLQLVSGSSAPSISTTAAATATTSGVGVGKAGKKLEKELQQERLLSTALSTKHQALLKELEELKEQNKDLMLALEFQQRMQNSEAAEGSIMAIVPPNSTTNTTTNRKKKR